MQAPTTFPQQFPWFGRGAALVIAVALVAIAAAVVVNIDRSTPTSPTTPAGGSRPYSTPIESFSVYVVATDADRFALLDVFDAFKLEPLPAWDRTSATRTIAVVTSAEQEAELEAQVLGLDLIRETIGLPRVTVYDMR
jgi:hypothetical protein